MENIPNISNKTESEITFDEIASALEEVFIAIKDCKQGITESEKMLTVNYEEYTELVGMLDSSNAEDKKELAKLENIQNEFVDQIHQDITRMKTIIAELESIHKRELKMFEDLKAEQREKDFGVSGTAH
jgi:hypothetical protein